MAARRDDARPAEASAPVVWERPEPPHRPAPVPLSRALIVRTAIELADADGLAAVSLRKVGAALGAGPMRLYRYLSTKDELLDLMVDAVHGELVASVPPAGAAQGEPCRPAPGTDGDARAALRALAHRTRRAALRHEWFVDLLGGRPPIGPGALAHFEASLAAVHGAPGFDHIDTVMRAVTAVHGYVTGAVRREIAELRAARDTGMDKPQWQAAKGPYLERMLATGRYPTLAEAVRIGEHPDPATVFDTGLDYLLDGITGAR